MLRVKTVKVPVDYRPFIAIADLIFGAGKRRHNKERYDIEAKFLKRPRSNSATIGGIERKSEHVTGMHRNAYFVPVVDYPAVFLKHSAARIFERHAMLPIICVLVLGR